MKTTIVNYHRSQTSRIMGLKERIIKQFKKIAENPEIGKPMRFTRKGTREVYVAPFYHSYLYEKKKNNIIMLDLYHKDQQ